MRPVLGVIGGLALVGVQETAVRLPPERLFLDWDDDAVAALRPAVRSYDPVRRVLTLPVRCWIIREPDRTILVDTGCGNGKRRPGSPRYHMLQTRFLEWLLAAGVRPEDVDTVVCTHLHVDHVGWNTRSVDGRWVPTFPNARYLVSGHELEYQSRLAESETADELIREVYRDSVLPIVEAGKMVTFDGAHEVGEGVAIRPAPGHTPGHVRVELRSRGRLGILCGDAIHTSLQGPFWSWRSALAPDPEQDVATRRALLEDCAEQEALLMPTHFPGAGVGRVRREGDRYAIDLGW